MEAGLAMDLWCSGAETNGVPDSSLGVLWDTGGEGGPWLVHGGRWQAGAEGKWL